MKDPVTPGELGKEIGVSGTYIQAGIISLSDYAAELTGNSGIQKFDEMRKGDSTVRASLLAVVLPILAGHWDMEAASDDAQDETIKEFTKHALFDGMCVTWQQFLREATMLYLAYGRMPFEKVFNLQEFDGKTYIGWEKFAPRHPRTIYRWQMSNGEAGVQQYDPNMGMYHDIPMEKLMIFVNEKEGDNWNGVSILRTAFKPWYMKDTLYKIEAIKAERQGLGIPYAKATAGKNISANEETKLQKQLSNMRAHERGFAIIPDGFEFGFFDMKASGTMDLQPAIQHHDRQITKNVLAQFLEIGGSKGSSGSLAASDNQMDLFVLSLQSVASYIQETVQCAINQLVDLNFPGYGAYPKLKVDKIGPDNAAKMADILQKLTSAKIITPFDEDEEFMREVLNMPDMPDQTAIDAQLIDRSQTVPSLPGATPPADPENPTEEADPTEEVDPTKQKSGKEMLIDEVTKLSAEVRSHLYG